MFQITSLSLSAKKDEAQLDVSNILPVPVRQSVKNSISASGFFRNTRLSLSHVNEFSPCFESNAVLFRLFSHLTF